MQKLERNIIVDYRIRPKIPKAVAKRCAKIITIIEVKLFLCVYCLLITVKFCFVHLLKEVSFIKIWLNFSCNVTFKFEWVNRIIKYFLQNG